MNKVQRIISASLFIIIIAVFSLINAKELLLNQEPDGRFIGLNQLETIRDDAVSLWSLMPRLTGQKSIYGSTEYEHVINLGDGYYALADPSASTQAGKTGALEGMALANQLDIPFLFVLVPPKQEASDRSYEEINDYALEKYNEFSSWLLDNDIPSLLMRDIFMESAEDYKSFFYKTDHHENTKAAFLIYQSISDYIDKNTSFDINESLLDINSYRIVHYEDIFLGSAGRLSGVLYTGLDDYELILPDFDTSVELITKSQGIDIIGTLEDTLVYYDNLDGYSYDYYAYYSYLNEDYDITKLINHNNPDGPKIIIIRDSTAVPVSCFLIMQCSEIELISLRYVDDNSSIPEYIIQENPDMIIYCFGSGFLGDEGAMCFN